MTTTQAPTIAAPDVAAKGLRAGSIGLLGSSVLGVVQTAPAYSIAVTAALLAVAAGLLAAALLLRAFVPFI